MSRQVALLRGVNLGKRKVVMSELRALAESAGFEDVETHLASGNLVLNSTLEGRKLEARLKQLILDGLGLQTEVFVREADELDSIIAANPFESFARLQPSLMVVAFMRGAASATEVAAMEASRAHEEFEQGEHCLYLRYPDGQGRSRLKLPRLCTARNWNTVTRLAAMARRK